MQISEPDWILAAQQIVHDKRNLQQSVRHKQQNYSEIDQTQATQAKQQAVEPHDITQLVIKLLPIIIKLFLIKDTTDKMQCHLELVNMLKAETVIADTLTNLGLTSI